MRDKYRERSYIGAKAKAAARDRLIFQITDDLLIIMENNGVTKNELARRLGKSKSYVSQVLSGRRNMTFGTFSDICFSLKFEPEIALPLENNNNSLYIANQECIEDQANREYSVRPKLTAKNTIKKHHSISSGCKKSYESASSQ